MLFDEPVLHFRGFTIYRDFSVPERFYFLPPEAPRIARSAEDDDELAMRLVLYRPDPNAAPPQGMEEGGGFFNLDTDLHVTEEELEEVREEIRRRFGSDADLVPVPFTEGSVELVLLGTARGDEGEPFVRKVAGTTTPSLYGTQRAAFSNVLDRNGAALMRQVIEEGGATMALVIYHLTYVGMAPAYNLKIRIHYERVYNKLDLDLKASVDFGSDSSTTREGEEEPRESSSTKFVGKAGFHLLIERLRETGAIEVEVTDPVPGEGGSNPSQDEINELIGKLMGSEWFKPTLAASNQLAQVPEMPSGDDDGDDDDSDEGESEGGDTDASGDDEGESEGGSDGDSDGESEGGSRQGERPAARWDETGRTPSENFPSRRSVGHTPAASGTSETLVVRGEGATATVDGQEVAVSGGRITVDVPPDSRKQVVVRWPAGEPPAPRRFFLFFDYDRPNGPPNDEVAEYVAGNPQPAEGPPQGEQPRFLEESRALGAEAGDPRGPDAFRAWLREVSAEVGSRDFIANAHASFEKLPPGDDTPTRRAARERHNQALSERRRQVAAQLAGGQYNFVGGVSHGHQQAMAGQSSSIPVLSDDTAPPNSREGRPQHRVVIIEPAQQPEASAGSTIRGTLSRGPIPRIPVPEPEDRERSSTSLEASFEVNLEIINREELKTVTYELNRRKARTQEIHPQGQLILDVRNPEDYILEADGAIDFFQSIDVAATTTAQWELDGIEAVHVQVRYGPLEDGSFRRNDELVLTKDQDRDEWTVGTLHENDDDDLPVVYWYEYRVTVHYRPDVALGDQSGAVSSAGVEGADEEGWFRTFERNLVIHPRDVTPAVTVNVATGLMRFDLLERVQLVLSYGPHRQNITLSPESTDHRLVIRPEQELEDESIRTEGTLFYRDGAQVPLPTRGWTTQELVVINEPREQMLRVRLLLADPTDAYERVVVNLRYDHGDRLVEDEITLTDHAQMEEWAVRLEDPEARAFSWKATSIKRSGDIDTTEWAEAEADQIILGLQAVDVIPVNVTWLMTPLPEGLMAVKVDLEYADEDNDLAFQHSELIRGDHPGSFTWSIPIRDPRRTTYRYRVTEFRATGAEEGEWREETTKQLVLLPGS